MYYTPLRYPGGKGKLAAYLKSVFEENDLCDGHYVEPYAGGAGVAMELLLLEYASHIHINDVDPAVYSFWKSAIDETDELCKKISSTRVTVNNWRKQREILKNGEKYSTLELGFATFFLNRTNRSGILKGGVIGGQEQAGRWKLNVRYNKKDLIERIEKIARFRNRISLYQSDAVKLVGELTTVLPSNTLFYLDPPYYIKGKGLYRNYYNHEDHVAIERAIRKVKTQRWLVSYDNVYQIKDIYSKYRQVEYSLSYTAHEKTKGSEVMIFGPKLKIPESVGPIAFTTAA